MISFPAFAVEDDDLVICQEKDKDNPYGDHISMAFVGNNNKIIETELFLLETGHVIFVPDDNQSIDVTAKWEKTNRGYFLEFQLKKELFKISDNIARANIRLYDTDLHLNSNNIYLKMETGYAKAIRNGELPYLILE